MGFEAPPVGHPAIRRALSAIAKRGQFVPRQKMFIPRCVLLRPPDCLHSDFCCRSFVSAMIAAVRHGKEDRNYAMLWLVTYSFLLRMPSEVGTFPPSHIACCFSRSCRLCHYASAHPIRHRQRESRRSSGGMGTQSACDCFGERIACRAVAC